MEDIILYHGSRGGLDGPIRPESRIRCDFGKGFYMGESQEQTKSLIIEDSSPVFYTVKLKLSEIPDNKILLLKDYDWLYAVLSNRQKIQEFNELEISKYWRKKLNKYDVIIGPIADDRMNEAMKRFSDFGLTDKGLIACLQSVKYGQQVVAKSEFACSKIEVISERELLNDEISEMRMFSEIKRKECKDIIKEMSIKYQRNGLYLNEIIDKEKQRELENEYER